MHAMKFSKVYKFGWQNKLEVFCQLKHKENYAQLQFSKLATGMLALRTSFKIHNLFIKLIYQHTEES